MTKVSDIANIIEVFAPLQLCFDGDNSGLCVGNMSNSVSGIIVCEDATLNVLKEAVSCNCNLVISHHPPIFTKAKRFLTGSQDCDIINYALCNNLNLYSAHTNLDACADGINCRLCEMFGLEVLSGDGEFWRIAKAKQIFTLKQFEQMVAKVLEDCHTKTVGKLDALCQKIAVASGSGGRDDDFVEMLKEQGVDTLVTSEVKVSIARKLNYYDIKLVEVGHFDSEKCCKNIFKELLADSGVMVIESLVEQNPYNN